VSARIGFVIPWFGRDQTGGAERQAWQAATRLAARGWEIDVLTTCCAGFQEDWSRNHHPPGCTEEAGVRIHRFRVGRRDRTAFDAANARLLAVPRSALRPGCPPADAETCATFVRENIQAPDLLRALERTGARYRALVFVPYLYGPSLEGVGLVAARARLLPCLHDEAYAYLPQVAAIFSAARGLLFHSEGEAELARRLYGPSVLTRGTVVGGGVEPSAPAPDGSGARAALERTGARFALYLGRRDPTKNTDLLARSYARFRAAHPDTPLRLVLAGPGDVPPEARAPGVVDLGLVDEAVKSALLRRCTALLQPSTNESFSRVMMEAWLAGRPVAVHGDCPATALCVRACEGGVVAIGEREWAQLFERLGDPREDAAWAEMGRAGRAYAEDAADWERVIDRYEQTLGLTSEPRPRLRPRRGRSVHQMLPTLAQGDAIGNHALFLRGWLREQGLRSEIFCQFLDPALAQAATPFRRSLLRSDDALIYHHSIGSELTPHVVAHPGPKLLVHHNITPGRFFAPWRPEHARLLDEGHAELEHLAPVFKHSVGDSTFNAEALAAAGFAEPKVLPLPVDPEAFREPADPEWMARLQDGSLNVLFVGRIAPNKRQEDLVACMPGLLARNPRLRLVLAGPETRGDPYARALRTLAERLGVADRVLLTGALSQEQLHACFRTAHLYWSMSEHEGFGVPLIESMWFDVPVLAFRAGAVAETLGEGGLLFREKRRPELIALVERLSSDDALREAILRAQRRRRRDFLPSALEPHYARAIEPLLGEAEERT
jgi:glycosyltransferase involved in cell wall biosynthesis